MRALELFSGLGGWRLALGSRGSVVAAYDISPHANAAYALNHGHAPLTKELARVPAAALAAHGADTWLMSPPCQPTCRMGQGRDLDDPRSRAFLHLLEVLREVPPRRLALENVEGFLASKGFARLMAVLDHLGWHRQVHRLCPSRFGLPNQRPRVYVVASRDPLPEQAPPGLPPPALAGFLDPVEDDRLYLGDAELARHRFGLDLVTAEDHRSCCFIGGYGRRYVGSGSFLKTDRGIRRFSPAEVARLLGYSCVVAFPEGMPLEARYKLLGNGLSIPVATWVLGAFGEAPDALKMEAP